MWVRIYGPDTDLGYAYTVLLTFEIWRWAKVMTTLLGYKRELCEMLSRSKIAVRSYGPDMDFGLHSMNLTLEL